MWILLTALACGPSPDESPTGPPTLALGDATLTVDDEGRISLAAHDGSVVLTGATAAVVVDGRGEDGHRLEVAGDGVSVETTEVDTPLGRAEALVIARTVEDLTLRWTVTGHEGGVITARLEVRNDGATPRDLTQLRPLDLQKGAGILAVGGHPSDTRVLDNGSYTLLDFVADLRPGDTGPSGWEIVAPGDMTGNTVANWDHAIADVASGGALVAGALTFDTAFTVLEASYDRFASARTEDGREGFAYYAAVNPILPGAKVLAPGGGLGSEVVWLDVSVADPVKGLEDYADAVGAWLGIVPWSRKGPGYAVPNGWNSWSASGSTGGYGTDIDETTWLANLDVMDRELRAWGMDWFQLDDGWEMDEGDWTWNTERFPHGPRWLTDRVHERGFRTGLWMSSFTANPEGTLVAEHPDWFASRGAGLGVVVGTEYAILDLTHPEVLDWLHELMQTVRNDWGFDWLKLDFGYYAMFGEDLWDPTLTREEAWRGAMRTVKDGLGEDAFLLAVGAMGINYGIADGNRLTLDAMPVWDRQPGDSATNILDQQGLKPTLRTAARRWYLSDRVWINHPDLILFRSNTRDPSWPRLTFEESRAFATFVGLSGGIVKLGDRVVDLQPEAIDVIRRLLPVYGHPASPVDVFEREFPELWHLEVEPRGGLTEPYHLVGLFHWGANTDTTTNPYTAIPDDPSPRHVTVDLARLGIEGPMEAWELWTEQGLGRVEGTLEVEVPAHDCRVVVLRAPHPEPAFLAWNRHVTGGGVLMGPVTWYNSAGALVVTLEATDAGEGTPFVHRLWFTADPGLAVGTPTADGVPVEGLEAVRESELVRVSFEARGTGTLTLTVPLQ